MYYRKALELQAFLDMAQDDGMSNGSFYAIVLNAYLLSFDVCADFSSLSIRSYGRLQSNRTDV
jgi:hypothetical protein